MEAIIQSVNGFRLTMPEVIAYPIILSFFVILWCRYKWNRRHFDKLASSLKGPPAYPIIGSALQFIGTPQSERNKTFKHSMMNILFNYYFQSSWIVYLK